MFTANRPLSVTLLACLYIATGAIALAGHLAEAGWRLQPDIPAIAATEVAAIVFGVFMFQARNWARWGSVLWMAFHVCLSFAHSIREAGIHAAMLALIAWLLFRRPANAWFRSRRMQAAA